MSDREFVESETKQLSILEGEKKSIEITLQAYEKSIATKIDSKAEKSLIYYREEIARAEAKFEDYRRYCNKQMEALTTNQQPDPERIVKHKMRLDQIDASILTKKLTLAHYAIADRPDYIPVVVLPPKTWKPTEAALAEEAECARMRAMQVPEFDITT
jgi:hypothetical protein